MSLNNEKSGQALYETFLNSQHYFVSVLFYVYSILFYSMAFFCWTSAPPFSPLLKNISILRLEWNKMTSRDSINSHLNPFMRNFKDA